MKYFRYAIIDMCDECRMTLMRNDKVTAKFVVKEISKGNGAHCNVCNRQNVFTMGVLTDYAPSSKSDDPNRLNELDKKDRRTIDEGFELLLLKDLSQT